MRIYRATIIRPDKLIAIVAENFEDSLYVSNELTWLPKNIHAIQWYGSEGTIEYIDQPEEKIYSFSPYYNYAVNDILEERKKIEEEKKQSFLDFIENPETFVRSRRNSLLNTSDWTQMPDSPLSDEKKNEWKIYRQQLRDLPDKITDFMLYIQDTTLWPEPPQ